MGCGGTPARNPGSTTKKTDDTGSMPASPLTGNGMVQQMKEFKGRRAVSKAAKAAYGVTILAVLAGCSSYEKLPQQSVDQDYKVFSATGGTSGDLKLFLLKAFEDDGKTALCGGFTSGASAISTNLGYDWANVSQIYLDDVKLGNADFMTAMPVYLKVGDDPKEIWTELARKKPVTNCVRTGVDWQPSFLDAKFERKGPNRISGFD